MAMRSSFAIILAATLASQGHSALAQEAESPSEPETLQPADVYESNEILDLYGFTDEPEANESLSEAPEPEFDGVPEGVLTDEDAAAIEDAAIEPDATERGQDIESGLLDALDAAPETFLPDEVEADAEYLESNPEFTEGLELSTGEEMLLQDGEFGQAETEGVASETDAPQVYIDPETGEILELLEERSADETEGDEQATEALVDDEQNEIEDAQSERQRVMESLSSARIRALDKISGAAEDIIVEVGETVSHKGLDVTVRACYQAPPEELPPESAAYVEVLSNRVNQETGSAAESDPRLFAGWMFASSPGLNALEHPIYDVWVINCSAVSPVSE